MEPILTPSGVTGLEGEVGSGELEIDPLDELEIEEEQQLEEVGESEEQETRSSSEESEIIDEIDDEDIEPLEFFYAETEGEAEPEPALEPDSEPDAELPLDLEVTTLVTELDSETEAREEIEPEPEPEPFTYNSTNGVFTVGETGKVNLDYLIDGGKYAKGEIGIFSLEGMEDYEGDAEAWETAAVRRALSNSTLGNVGIADGEEGAKFSGILEGELEDWNRGKYQFVDSVSMNPGEQFALVISPKTPIEQAFEAEKPLFFSNDSTYENFADVTGEGHTFTVEDWRDADYNDVVFQVNGARGEAVGLDEVIDPEAEDWRDTEVGQQVLDYIAPVEFDSGVFTVGESGEVGIDFLYDGGKWKGELALFSLEGLEEINPNSGAFIEEAASRALSSSELGHVIISDRAEGARFDGVLGDERQDWNAGDYRGVKTFDMNPGDRFGMMLLPKHSVSKLADNPALGGLGAPLFSMSSLNPEDAYHLGQLADVTGDGNTFVMEDWRVDHHGSDEDYNDFIFQVRGATANAVNLDEVINPEYDWRESDLGKGLLAYAKPYVTPETPELGEIIPEDVYEAISEVRAEEALELAELEAEEEILETAVTEESAAQESVDTQEDVQESEVTLSEGDNSTPVAESSESPEETELDSPRSIIPSSLVEELVESLKQDLEDTKEQGQEVFTETTAEIERISTEEQVLLDQTFDQVKDKVQGIQSKQNELIESQQSLKQVSQTLDRLDDQIRSQENQANQVLENTKRELESKGWINDSQTDYNNLRNETNREFQNIWQDRQSISSQDVQSLNNAISSYGQMANDAGNSYNTQWKEYIEIAKIPDTLVQNAQNEQELIASNWEDWHDDRQAELELLPKLFASENTWDSQPLPKSNPPIVGIIDTGFDPNALEIEPARISVGQDWVEANQNALVQPAEGHQHGTQILEVINDINDQSPLWLGRGVRSGDWAQSLIEFVDTVKDSEQSNAVINLSFDLTETRLDGTEITRQELTSLERAALTYAQQNKVLIVASAGNEGTDLSALGQAAQQFDNLVVVGAADGWERAEYSSYNEIDYIYGQGVDLLAQGTAANGASGTSVAAAKVTGAASLMWSANPDLNYTQVIDLLRRSSTDLATPGWDNETGAGLLNIAAAVYLAKETEPEAYKSQQWELVDDILEEDNIPEIYWPEFYQLYSFYDLETKLSASAWSGQSYGLATERENWDWKKPFKKIGEGIKKGVNKVVETVTSFTNDISDFVKNAWDGTKRLGKDILDKGKVFVEQAWELAKDNPVTLAAAVASTLSGAGIVGVGVSVLVGQLLDNFFKDPDNSEIKRAEEEKRRLEEESKKEIAAAKENVDRAKENGKSLVNNAKQALKDAKENGASPETIEKLQQELNQAEKDAAQAIAAAQAKLEETKTHYANALAEADRKLEKAKQEFEESKKGFWSKLKDSVTAFGEDLAQGLKSTLENIDVGAALDLLKRIPVVGTVVSAAEGLYHLANEDWIEAIKETINGALALFGLSTVVSSDMISLFVDLAWELKDKDYKGAIAATLHNLGGMSETVAETFTNIAWEMKDGDWKSIFKVGLEGAGFDNSGKFIDIAWDVIDGDYKGALGTGLTFAGFGQQKANTLVDIAWDMADNRYGKALKTGFNYAGFSNSNSLVDLAFDLKDGDYENALNTAFNASGLGAGKTWVDIAFDFKNGDYKSALETGLKTAGFSQYQDFIDTAWDFKAGNYERALISAVNATGLGNAAQVIERAFAEYSDRSEPAIAPSAIPAQHKLYEYFARSIAYEDPSISATPETALSSSSSGGNKLTVGERINAGYTVDRVIEHPSTGFYAVGLRPDDPSQPPVLLLRGTGGSPTDEKYGTVIDVLEDTNPEGIGYGQFSAHQAEIQAWLAAQTQPVDLVGHSLGGALAQTIAAHFPTEVGEIVTFNSPGINSDTAELFVTQGGNPNSATHYITSGDLVSMAGEEYLPGRAVLASYPNLNVFEKHSLSVLGSNAIKSENQASEVKLTALSVEDLSSPSFGYDDRDYTLFLAIIALISPPVATALTTRRTTETSRQAIGSVLHGAIDTVKNWLHVAKSIQSEDYLNALTHSLDLGSFAYTTEWENMLEAVKQRNYVETLTQALTTTQLPDAGDWLNLIGQIDNNQYMDALTTGFKLADFGAAQTWIDIAQDIEGGEYLDALSKGFDATGFTDAAPWISMVRDVGDGNYLNALRTGFNATGFEAGQSWVDMAWHIQEKDYLKALRTGFDFAGYDEGKHAINAGLAVKEGDYFKAFTSGISMIDGVDDLVDTLTYLKDGKVQEAIPSMVNASAKLATLLLV
ncbi:DUF4114 domain-containing protein [Roseofilum sp. BLCC_M91]|uniref:DUF4114 domain-containing protein n=1 Tax=Roseofilum halophilum BLCC-M91 TaxID=3022259 RepID=A0ABT7BLQ5_9CYAN|nr:DUF4114 domain-containing protein [Roseofilum halophilum]MDJ1180116.1 DUF4114 domain-containing protein [Roseofilum halophilum BLCC-M91]